MNSNGAKTIFGAIPGANSLIGTARGENEAAWWKIVEDAFSYAFDTFPEADLGWVPTLAQAKEIRANAISPAVLARNAARGDARKHWKNIPSTYDPDRVQAMFKRWYLYYPFVDEVAVAKAVGFHADAWDGLTTREHRAVIRRLASMEDPWEDANIIQRGPGDTSLSKGQKSPLATTSPRASRWLSYPFKERKVLLDTVSRRKRSHGA
jgi:hypothetical protein